MKKTKENLFVKYAVVSPGKEYLCLQNFITNLQEKYFLLTFFWTDISVLRERRKRVRQTGCQLELTQMQKLEKFGIFSSS